MKLNLIVVAVWLVLCHPLAARADDSPSNTAREAASPVDATAGLQQKLSFLIDAVAAQGRRIQELEERLATRVASSAPSPAPAPVAASLTPETQSLPPVEAASALAPAIEKAEPADMSGHDHMIRLPGGGPVLSIRGFMDFNADIGQAGNHLIFPIGAVGHTSFQVGEFDLFLSSKLSKHISFVAEVVIGAGRDNYWGLDIERLQLTYRHNRYFEISGGRYHTAIGYYNTTFHHGTWFQTATGRPFMYYFEDSGGILPVHNVGITTTGLVPHTGQFNLHWIAEIGNGRSSANDGQPVQNFLSGRTHKSANFAAYIKPEGFTGLQIGGSYYRDRLFPAAFPDAKVSQNIESAYVVYTNAGMESLNECVLLNNRLESTGKIYRTPMCYAQISQRLHNNYRPYFRYQYLTSPTDDPLNSFTGRYQGPSVGIRFDFTEFVALKLQYNHFGQRDAKALNGLQAQAAFAF